MISPPPTQFTEIDISGMSLTSLRTLGLHCPDLKSLNVSDNNLTSLEGCPPKLLEFYVTNNHLDDLTNFSHIPNATFVDVSRNRMTSLGPLKSLTHLQELLANQNMIDKLSDTDIQDMLAEADPDDDGYIRFEDLIKIMLGKA